MKFSSMTMFSIKLIPISVMLAMGVAQAATNEPVAAVAASGVVVKTAPTKVTTGKVTPKVAAGTITGKGGENQYPSGTIPVPPKPKKEGLEAAAATKVKAAQP